MVPQHLVYKADQLLRRALDLAQEPVLHNTYQRAHIELGQHGELLLPSLIPQLRDNQTDRALDNSTDIRLEEPLQVVPTHRAKGAEAERTILLQVLEKLSRPSCHSMTPSCSRSSATASSSKIQRTAS